MKRLLMLTALLLVLAACQSSDNSGGGGEISETEAIQWDRNPDTVVFRAEVLGGEFAEAFFARSEVPNCTLYGDNRIVWTVTSAGSDSQVLYDRLTDQQIRAFIGTLTVDQRIFTYNAQADQQLPSKVSPVYEKLTVFVNGQEHVTDGFGGWPFDYYRQILELCRGLSQAPVEYVPEEAWISAVAVDYDPGVPSVTWDGEAAGLKFSELAASGERKWVTGRNVSLLWRVLRANTLNMHFLEESGIYQIAIEAPGINPSAPPKPG